MSESQLLLGDIGGTHARFALATPTAAGYRQEQVLQCADFESPEAAIAAYLEAASVVAPAVACLAVAGPVKDGVASLTNRDWRIAADELKQALGIEVFEVVNDFAAVAMSVPALGDADLLDIGELSPAPPVDRRRCVGVIGPGTGLGAAGLLSVRGVHEVLTSEAGHAGFAPMSQLQVELNEVTRARFGRVSCERLLSGPGLENIYAGLCEVWGLEPKPLQAADVFSAALDGGDGVAVASVELFFEILGQVAGDFALSIGAFDGVYIAGGVVRRYAQLLQNSRFRMGFEEKGRLAAQLRGVPTALIVHPQPGLLGACEVARSMAKEVSAR